MEFQRERRLPEIRVPAEVKDRFRTVNLRSSTLMTKTCLRPAQKLTLRIHPIQVS